MPAHPGRVEALPPGGAFIAIENLIDDERRENVFSLMMSLNMLIEFGDAFDFTGADSRAWCEEAGFQAIEVLPSPVRPGLASPTSSGTDSPDGSSAVGRIGLKRG